MILKKKLLENISIEFPLTIVAYGPFSGIGLVLGKGSIASTLIVAEIV